MLPYFIFMTLPAFPAFLETSRYSRERDVSILYLVFFILAFFFVGLRFQVGSDWYGYERIFEFAKVNDFSTALVRSEPGYMLLNWAAARLGLTVVSVNLVCAAIAVFCCYKFCALQNRPWLAAFITSSYVLIVIVMGLTRQGVAVALFFYALTFLFAERRTQYLICIALAAMFHISVLVTLPLVAFIGTKSHIKSILLFTLFLGTVVAYVSFSEITNLDDQYFSRELSSGGAAPRFAVHMLAVSILFLFRRRFLVESTELRIWTLLAIGVLTLFLALPFAPSSTVLDRLAFYALPLQVFVFSNLPNIVRPDRSLFAPVLVGVILLYYVIIGTWFVFGATSGRFVPYMLPFGS